MHKPECTATHRFDCKKRCCGKSMTLGERTCDMIDAETIIKEAIIKEARHLIETTTCKNCNKKEEAPNDLPKSGSYGKTLADLNRMLHCKHMPLKGIACFMEQGQSTRSFTFIFQLRIRIRCGIFLPGANIRVISYSPEVTTLIS